MNVLGGIHFSYSCRFGIYVPCPKNVQKHNLIPELSILVSVNVWNESLWGQELRWQNVSVWQDIIMIWVSVDAARCRIGEVRVVTGWYLMSDDKNTLTGVMLLTLENTIFQIVTVKNSSPFTQHFTSLSTYLTNTSTPSVCWNKCVNCSYVTESRKFHNENTWHEFHIVWHLQLVIKFIAKWSSTVDLQMSEERLQILMDLH